MKKALKNILKVFIFFIAWAICVSIGEINSDNPAIWRFWAEAVPLLWTLLLTIIFLCIERGRVKIPVFHNIAKGLIPVLNVITMSLFMTALYEKTQNIVAPILAHAVWNIAGAIILGGVSLADDYPSLFTMTSAGNVLISGGDYKIEGSIIVLVIDILFALFFWLWARKLHKAD